MLWLAVQCANVSAAPREEVEEVVELGRVPAGFPVGFCLLTTPERQYVAYYDELRQMTVQARKPGAKQWVRKVLPSKVEWDSHNYITMAVDTDGQLHVSGNMHNVPLIYFRTTVAGDIETLESQAMTGKLEKRMTYPRFMADTEGRLLFTYRHGGSGNGINFWNRYDSKSQSWSRLLDVPLLDGLRKTNAYPTLPRRHGDYFHMIWVWRDTPDCATNHHLSYARSRDMVHWESAFGDPLKLPITIDRSKLWVDPAPAGSGMINGGQRLFFDEKGHPLVVYHKRDEQGMMQVYAARPGKDAWIRQALTQWKHPVPFGGNGSMGFIGISMGQVMRHAPGALSVSYHHRDLGRGRLIFDERELKLFDRKPEGVTRRPVEPAELRRLHSEFPGMALRRATDIGESGEEGVRYVLTWETLGRNRDWPRQPPLPEPSILRLYKLRVAAE